MKRLLSIVWRISERRVYAEGWYASLRIGYFEIHGIGTRLSTYCGYKTGLGKRHYVRPIRGGRRKPQNENLIRPILSRTLQSPPFLAFLFFQIPKAFYFRFTKAAIPADASRINEHATILAAMGVWWDGRSGICFRTVVYPLFVLRDGLIINKADTFWVEYG